MPQSTYPYSVHPSVAMVRTWIDTLPQKTGRSLDEWMRLVEAQGLPTAKERTAWLKAEHGLGTNSAGWIAETSLGTRRRPATRTTTSAAPASTSTPCSPARKRCGRSTSELLKLGLALAPDVKACPCKTIVPLYRNHVFAQIKPTTKTRIDLGFALKDTPATGRLIDTGGFAKKDRITHRIPIASLAEIDDEVRRWLKVAYEMDA